MKKRFLVLSLVMMLFCSLFAPMSVKAETSDPTYTVLLLDISSTHKFLSSGQTIYTADSASNFSKSLLGLNSNHYVAVVAYNSKATTVSDFTQDSNKILNGINKLSSSDNSACITTALDKAHSLLSSVSDKNATKNVVLFTTGFNNTGAYTYSGKYNSSTPGNIWQNSSTKVRLYAYANAAIKSAQVLHEYANVYTVGLFENWDGMPSKGQELVEFFKMFTQDLANPLENYNPVYSKNDLDSAFAQICNSIIDNPFADVTYQGYYWEAVLWAEEEGITSGTNFNTFDPGEICTREQMVTFLWRKAGKPEPQSTTTPFKDVADPSRYSYKPILWATENGITKGTSATTFSPTQTVTREQVVTFLWRIEGSPKATAANAFKDVSKSAYSYDAILWAQENGITMGTTPTTFSPADPCTRGQIITFMYRYYVK